MTRPWLWPLLIAIVIAATILSIAVGSAAISPGRIVAALTGDGDRLSGPRARAGGEDGS